MQHIEYRMIYNKHLNTYCLKYSNINRSRIGVNAKLFPKENNKKRVK